ncbi:hypothetical protein ACFL3T_00895 [Patescibacteria group bacterium]
MTNKPGDKTLGEQLAGDVRDAATAEAIAADKEAITAVEEDSPGLNLAQLAEQSPGVEAKAAELQQETQVNVAALPLEEQFVLQHLGTFKFDQPDDLITVETDEPWKVLAPRPRMFQEAFCRQPFIAHKDGKTDDKEYNDGIIDYALVSPMLFPETLWEHVTGVVPNGTKTSHEGMKARYILTGQLKSLFQNIQPICDDNLEPIKEDSGRISVLPRYNDKLTAVNVQQPWPRGSIIVSSNPTRKEGPKRHFSFYDNFYSFLRSLKHTLNNYSGRYAIRDLEKRSEFEVLNQLRSDIRASIDTLQNWKKLSPDQKEEVQGMIKELKGLLAGVKDQYKIMAKDHLGDAESLKERQSQKYNSGCTCAKLVGGFNDVMERFRNCVGIEKSVEDSLVQLEETQEAVELIFTNLDINLDQLIGDDFFNKNRFLREEGAAEYVLENAQNITERLDQDLIAQLEALVENDSLPAPYPQWAEAMRQNLKAAQIIIKRIGQMDEKEVKALGPVGLEKVHEEAMKNMTRADVASRCIDTQMELSSIINKILTRPWDFDPITLYDDVDTVHRLLDPHAYREHYPIGDVGAKVLFKIKEVDQLSQYCRDLKHMLKGWQRERMRIGDEQEWYQGTYQDIPTEEYLENLCGFEDAKIDLDVTHLNRVYDDIRAYDFEKLFKILAKPNGVHRRTSVAHRFLENMNLYLKTVEDTPAAGE